MDILGPFEKSGLQPDVRTAVHDLIARYDGADSATRAAIRALFERCRSFRWAATLPLPADTPETFRAHLLLLSARDQGADARDELLYLRDVCREAEAAGVTIAPILREVASLSSDVDKQGMGSMRALLLACAR
jgi:hypothetical protein